MRNRVTPTVNAVAKVRHGVANAKTDEPRTRQLYKNKSEVNISTYFSAEMKLLLRLMLAKAGNDVKECLAEPPRIVLRKYNVPAPTGLGEGQ